MNGILMFEFLNGDNNFGFCDLGFEIHLYGVIMCLKMVHQNRYILNLKSRMINYVSEIEITKFGRNRAK